jgi:hypothetical protein
MLAQNAAAWGKMIATRTITITIAGMILVKADRSGIVPSDGQFCGSGWAFQSHYVDADGLRSFARLNGG